MSQVAVRGKRKSLAASEFTKQSISLGAVCGVGLLSTVEAPKVVLLSSVPYLRHPLPSLGHVVDAFVPRRVVGVFSLVALVLRGRGNSQIAPPVIVSDHIPMVDLNLRPLARHVEPSESVRQIRSAKYRDEAIALV